MTVLHSLISGNSNSVIHTIALAYDLERKRMISIFGDKNQKQNCSFK